MDHGDYVEVTLDIPTGITDCKLDHVIMSEGLTSEIARCKRKIRSNQTRLDRIRRQSPISGLRFVGNNVHWNDIERRFKKSAVNGALAKDKFGAVIGMSDSKEFAGELHDSLLRLFWDESSEGLSIHTMRMYWEQVASEDIDHRMLIFFNLCDKSGIGMLSTDDVCEAIVLSASANQLDEVKSQAEYYAALVMVELDSDNKGYLELWNLCQFIEKLYRSRPIYKRTSTNPETSVELLRSPRKITFPNRFWKPISTTKNYFQTWMHLTVPACFYAYDRGLTFMDQTHPVNILKHTIHQGNVLALYMTKPFGFKYKFGMYVLLKFPEISDTEWYPFSIVSAPNDNYIRAHMNNSMGLREWTVTTLQEKIARIATDSNSSFDLDIGSTRVEYDFYDEPIHIPYIIMKGPYGLPAPDYKKYDVVLVIGFGLGATLYFSILKCLLNTLKKSSTQDIERKKGAHKSYFHWVTNHQSSFDVFKDVFDKSADYVSVNNVIEMHNYLTSVYEEGDARSVMVQIVQSLEHAKTGVDVISGTRIKTHFGAPNWKDVFVQLALKHKSKNIGVYYSGSNEQLKLIRKLCQDFSYDSTTHFHFHFHNNLF